MAHMELLFKHCQPQMSCQGHGCTFVEDKDNFVRHETVCIHNKRVPNRDEASAFEMSYSENEESIEERQTRNIEENMDIDQFPSKELSSQISSLSHFWTENVRRAQICEKIESQVKRNEMSQTAKGRLQRASVSRCHRPSAHFPAGKVTPSVRALFRF